MLAAVLLATVLVAAEGTKPPGIYDDLLNGVKWSTTHDYEVHDHDADQDNQPDDGERYFTILVPTVALESVQDHQVQRSVDSGKYQVSVEVNGDSGLVDPSLERTSPATFINEEEILHHGDFDKVQPKRKIIPDIKGYSGEIDVTSDGTLSKDSDFEYSSEEVIEEGVLGIQNDGVSGNTKHEKEVKNSDMILETTDEKFSLADSETIFSSDSNNGHNTHLDNSSEEIIEHGDLETPNDGGNGNNMHEKEVHNRAIIFETTDDKLSLADSVGTDIDMTDSINGHLSSDVESAKSDGVLISETEPSNKEINYNMFRNSEPYKSFAQDTTVKESVQLPNKSPSKTDISIITTSQAIALQEVDQDQHSPASTVANTPLIKVHLLEETSSKKENTQYKGSIVSPRNSRIHKIKSFKDSPITRISNGYSELIAPRLIKEVLPKPERRKILIEVKKKARPLLKPGDSAVSSTTDSLSAAHIDDKLYDDDEKEEENEEEEEEEEVEDDLQNSPQDQIVNSNPIQAQDPAQENLLLLYGLPSPEGIPIGPLPPPYPEQHPTKIHQPILHHIIHAILSPQGPYDEEFQEDALLHRYSPNFVPYPAYLAIPY